MTSLQIGEILAKTGTFSVQLQLEKKTLVQLKYFKR
jgi:hypothetical protein